MIVFGLLGVAGLLVACGTVAPASQPLPTGVPTSTATPAATSSPRLSDAAELPIAMVTDADGGARLYLTGTDGERRPLAPASAPTVHGSSPTWSPDGRRLAFLRLSDSGMSELVVHDPTSGDERVVTEVGPPSTTDPRVSWSPDGSRIAYWSTSGTDNEIMLADVDGGAAPENVTRHEAADRYPAWSPDGAWIAFWSDRSGHGAVWLASADGGDLRQLAEAGAMYGPVAWSPDSSRIAVPIEQPGERWLIHLVDVKGRLQAGLSAEGSVLGASWAPDGQSIAYWQTIGFVRQLWLAGPDGSDPRPIGPAPAAAAYRLASHPADRWPVRPSWSPDSAAFAVEWSAGGRVEVLVIQREGDMWASLTPAEVSDGSPDWRPASRMP